MSYFICDSCKVEHDLFGRGGAAAAAEELGLPFLGEIPIEAAIRESGDAGEPIVARVPDSKTAKLFNELAERTFGQVVAAKEQIESRRRMSLRARNRGEIGPDTSLKDACELCPDAPIFLQERGMRPPREDERLDGGVPVAAVADRWGIDLEALLTELNSNLAQPPAKDHKGKLPVLSR